MVVSRWLPEVKDTFLPKHMYNKCAFTHDICILHLIWHRQIWFWSVCCGFGKPALYFSKMFKVMFFHNVSQQHCFPKNGDVSHSLGSPLCPNWNDSIIIERITGSGSLSGAAISATAQFQRASWICQKPAIISTAWYKLELSRFLSLIWLAERWFLSSEEDTEAELFWNLVQTGPFQSLGN